MKHASGTESFATPPCALKFRMNVVCIYFRGAYCSSQMLTRICCLDHNVGNGMIRISSPAMSVIVNEQNNILSKYLFIPIGLFYPAIQDPYFI